MRKGTLAKTVMVAAAVRFSVAGKAGADDLLVFGGRRCADYTAARQGSRAGNQRAKVEEIGMTSWAAGYLQAFHQCLVQRGTHGIIAGANVMGRALTFLDQTCQAHPSDSFALAVTMAGGHLAGVEFKR